MGLEGSVHDPPSDQPDGARDSIRLKNIIWLIQLIKMEDVPTGLTIMGNVHKREI